MRTPCTALRCCWINIVFWNPSAPTNGESDGSKDKFHKEIEQMFHQLPANYMNIVLRDQFRNRERRYFHLHVKIRVHIKIENTLVLE
jgi:hypothetical protein